ncbi:MAG TPA: SdrD B-like domain-containing protein [Gemmataceae bacterium]|nr:SdrD B-like domain-containing protein [Gemmataceae bacterium]
MYGGLQVSTSGNEIVNGNVSLGSLDNPGLTVQGGVVTQVRFSMPQGIAIWNLQLNASDLTWEYDFTQQHYAIYGTASLSTNYPVYFAGSLGDRDAPGVTISGATGKVEGFRMEVVNPMIMSAVAVEVQNLVFQYNAAQEEYQLSGTLSVPELFNATAVLGTANQPAIVFKNGQFQFDNFTLSLSDVSLGAFVIDNLTLIINYDHSDLSFEVDAVVWFPANFAVQAQIGFDNGNLNTIGFGASGLNIEIGDTGLVLKGISGEVKNFDHPSDIVVSGSLTVAWGDTMENFQTPFGPRDLALFGAKGAFTVDKDMLYLEGDFYAGMWLDPVTGTPTGVIGNGKGWLRLDWGDLIYQAHLEVNGYWDIFQVAGTVTITGGGEIFFLAKAGVRVPDFIPFIGGDTLGDLDFALRYAAGDSYSNDFVAGWVHIDLFFFSTEIGVKVNFEGHVSVIGHHQIDAIEQGSREQPQSYQYYASFIAPTGATSALLTVSWPEALGNQSVAVTLPDGTVIDQSQFSTANGIGLVPSLSSRTSLTVHLVGSATDPDKPLPQGQYQLTLTSNAKFSRAPVFTSGFFYPKPTIALGQLPSPSSSGTIAIPLQATVDESFTSVATVSLFYDYDGAGYDGTPIPGLQSIPYRSLGATVPWNLTGLLPVPHYVYAVINDGTNVPVKSAYSNPLIPQPPLSGQVSDLAHGGQAISGLTVYLDLNHNGQFDPNTDPSSITGSAGFYSFYGLTPNTPYTVAVVVPHGYQMDPHSPSPNPTTITWDGQDQVVVDFGLDLLAAIRGTVYRDSHQNGVPDPDAVGLSGWTVYLDTNGNGQRDAGEVAVVTDTSGRYTFYNVALNTTYTVAIEQRPNYFQTAPTPIPPGTRTVATSNDPFDLIDQQDFSVYPFLTIGGTITGYELHNGVLNSTTTPLEGWTVTLMQGSQVVGSTTTLADGSYSFTGSFLPGTYTVSQAVPSGWREIQPFTSDLQLWRHQTSHVPGEGTPLPTSVAAADFDGNGQIDFAVLDSVGSGYQVWIYYNGSFDSPRGYQIQSGETEGVTFKPTANLLKIVAGDFDGDGRQDLAVLDKGPLVGHLSFWGPIQVPSGGAWILRNEGSGFSNQGPWILPVHDGTTTTPIDLRAGRFLSGGGEQLVASYHYFTSHGERFGLGVFPFNGKIAISEGFIQGSGILAIGDINGDGIDDIVQGDYYRSPMVYYGSGNGTFSTSQSQSINVLPAGETVVVGDINGDGLLDIGVFDAHGKFNYALQSEAGTFSAPLAFSRGSGTYIPSVFLRDVNGDLRPDLVWVTEQPAEQFYALYVALNTGSSDGWFTAAQLTNWSLAPNGVGALSMAVADLNHNGLPEMVVTDESTGNVTVVWNDSVTMPTPITVQLSGQNSTNNNFVNAQFGQINGRAFEDVTRDGNELPGKPGHAGVSVYVDLNRNGRLDPGEPVSVTGPHGLYAFDGLAAGTYQVRVIPEVGRRLTTPAAGFHEVTVTAGQPVSGKHFGSAASVDMVLAMPTNAGEWTVYRNRDRLEVRDSNRGVIASQPLDELYSLTINGADGRPDRLTLDLTAGDFFQLPGGITFHDGRGTRDTLQLLLGNAANLVTVNGPQAMIDAGLMVNWNGAESLVIDTGGGNDRLSVAGQPVPAGFIHLLGGAGDDTYVLATQDSALRIRDSSGLDTLDFRNATARVRVDLRQGRGQTQRIGAGNNTLAIHGTIEDLIGTAFDDTLLGNRADNLIRGLEGNDVLRGFGGDDQLDGGDGDDVLAGGRNNDILRGEAGNDRMIGGSGRNLLLGGEGSDRLFSRKLFWLGNPHGGSILIGGDTVYSANEQALQAILMEWAMPWRRGRRIQDLTNGGNEHRQNGDYFLNAETLLDDGIADVLIGDSWVDWFLSFPGDRVLNRHS